MDKIMFKITKNLLSISLLKKDTLKEDLNNTNIIDTKEVVFSKDYILENHELVSSFLNVVVLKRNVTKVNIKDFEIVLLIMKILNNIPSIEELNIKAERIISYNIFLALLENKTIKKLDVYDMPKYLLERLDTNKDLEINVSAELFFVSSFMADNNLNTYSDIYYKKSIDINADFDYDDYNDFETFFNINNHLKTINIIHFDETAFKYIMETILYNNFENIKINIVEKDNDLNLIYSSITTVKNTYDKFLKERFIIFKINYSAEYKRNNLFKQLNINFLKISLISVIVVIIALMGINYYKNYTQTKDIEKIESELADLINQIDKEYSLDDQETDVEYIEKDGTENIITTTKSNYVSSYYKNYDKVFETLLKINSDTKGWLTVNNTRIDYPVVQAKDNDYYIGRDYNKYKNSMGWIFMDFRNNIDNLNQNTIIYGHNITAGIMFGTLRYTMNESWYKKPENQIITFNTLNTAMKWQIFSIYKLPNTNDYLGTTFYEKDEYQKFLNLILGRSIHDFKIDINTEDKILTLSTCMNRGDDRLVVHAKLITE